MAPFEGDLGGDNVGKGSFIFVGFICVLVVALMAFGVLAGEREDVEALAVRYVTTLEEGKYDLCEEISRGAALSLVQYREARAPEAKGPVRVIAVESSPGQGYYLVKIVYENAEKELTVKYVKAKKQDDSKWYIVDEGRRGRSWAQENYFPGIMFNKPDEIEGLRVSVAGVLELSNEIKFDLVLENTTQEEKSIYPQLEAYYTVETAKIQKRYYYPVPLKKNVLDGIVPPKSKKNGFLIFPKFTRDFGDDPSLEGLKWILFIPYRVTEQFVIFQ